MSVVDRQVAVMAKVRRSRGEPTEDPYLGLSGNARVALGNTGRPVPDKSDPCRERFHGSARYSPRCHIVVSEGVRSL
jgi:hypothetical protein